MDANLEAEAAKFLKVIEDGLKEVTKQVKKARKNLETKGAAK